MKIASLLTFSISRSTYSKWGSH